MRGIGRRVMLNIDAKRRMNKKWGKESEGKKEKWYNNERERERG